MLDIKPLYTQDQLATLIPHQPPMLLVDAVTAVDNSSLTAVYRCHQQAHPLAPSGVWPNYLLIEFAAQAIACHGALAGQQAFSRASIGRIKSTVFHCDTLNDYRDKLITVVVDLIDVNGPSCLYHFGAYAEQQELARGTALLIGVPKQ